MSGVAGADVFVHEVRSAYCERVAARTLTLQRFRDRLDRIPVPRRHQHVKLFVRLAQVLNDFHVSAIHTENESSPTADQFHQPCAGRGKDERVVRLLSGFLVQKAHEPDSTRTQFLACEWVVGKELEDILPTTDHDLRCERQLPGKCLLYRGLCAASAHNEGPGGPDVQDVQCLQLLGQLLRTECPVAADVDASQQNDVCHATPLVSALLKEFQSVLD